RSGITQLRPTERSQYHFTIYSDNPELVARRVGMPAHIDYAAHTVFVIDHDRRGILHRQPAHHVRQMTRHARRLAEEKIEHVDAMGSDIVQRTSAGLFWIHQPTPVAILGLKPVMAVDLSQNRASDGALLQQLSRALHLQI